MKQILRYSLVALLAVMGFGNAMAEKEVVFDFNAMDLATSHGANADQGIEASTAGDITETWTNVVDGVTISISPKEEGKSNENRFWATNNGPQLRCYSGTITIKASENMTGITFTSATNKFNMTANTGTVAEKKWSGEAAEVVFTVAGNTQLDKITITIGGEANPPQPEEQTITVAKALEIINELEDGAKTTEAYTVKGYVVAVTEISTSYGNATFTIADEKGGSPVLTVFRAKGFDGANITNPDLLKADDLVEVNGLLQKYVKDGNMTPEGAQGGKIVSINGKTEDDAPNPEDAITTGTDASNPMTVDQALSYINGFSNGFITTKQYYVQGKVSEVTEISTDNGNATFKMGNLVVFRVKGLENKNITNAEYLQANDEVVILAKLQKYVKNDEVTPELSSGYIYMLNGKTTEGGDDPGPGTLVGDGSKNNPYTVSDLFIMAVPESTSATEGQEMVWVKGVIIGALNSSGKAFDETVASNIALGATAGEEDATKTVPVQLPTGTMRAGLNVVDNPSNKGKEVMVYGYLLKYMSRTGIKNVSAYILDGNEVSGITNIIADQKNGAVYNVAGQMVTDSYKGLVIKNGKKTIQK